MPTCQIWPPNDLNKMLSILRIILEVIFFFWKFDLKFTIWVQNLILSNFSAVKFFQRPLVFCVEVKVLLFRHFQGIWEQIHVTWQKLVSFMVCARQCLMTLFCFPLKFTFQKWRPLIGRKKSMIFYIFGIFEHF